MIKIKFLNNWCDLEKQLSKMNMQTESGNNRWNDMIATSDDDKVDYFVIMEGHKDARKIQKNRKIYVQREPNVLVSNHQFDNDECVFCASYKNHYHMSSWRIKKPFIDIKNLKINKNKTLSFINSNKRYTKPQCKRIEIAKKINDMKLGDVYGGGFNKLNYDSYCKLNGMVDYKFSVAIENSGYHNYFTEKIIDCFLGWSKPLYWGCPNIYDYFPKDSLSLIDIYSDNVIDQIMDEINKPVNYDAIEEARNLVLYKYNVWPSIYNIIKNL